MMNKEEYKKELVRMWDSLRVTNKGKSSCDGVLCRDCQLALFNCDSSAEDIVDIFDFDIYKTVEKWSKEHPQKKYKVSKLEYSILEAYMDLSNCGSVKMLDFPVFNRLHELGYFKGATTDTYTRDYFENCEVEEDV